MSYYFQKCCFDADVIGKRTERDRLSCEGKHTDLLYSFIKLILNKKQLEEYWKCIVKDQEVFCPEKNLMSMNLFQKH